MSESVVTKLKRSLTSKHPSTPRRDRRTPSPSSPPLPNTPPPPYAEKSIAIDELNNGPAVDSSTSTTESLPSGAAAFVVKAAAALTNIMWSEEEARKEIETEVRKKKEREVKKVAVDMASDMKEADVEGGEKSERGDSMTTTDTVTDTIDLTPSLVFESSSGTPLEEVEISAEVETGEPRISEDCTASGYKHNIETKSSTSLDTKVFHKFRSFTLAPFTVSSPSSSVDPVERSPPPTYTKVSATLQPPSLTPSPSFHAELKERSTPLPSSSPLPSASPNFSFSSSSPTTSNTLQVPHTPSSPPITFSALPRRKSSTTRPRVVWRTEFTTNLSRYSENIDSQLRCGVLTELEHQSLRHDLENKIKVLSNEDNSELAALRLFRSYVNEMYVDLGRVRGDVVPRNVRLYRQSMTR